MLNAAMQHDNITSMNGRRFGQTGHAWPLKDVKSFPEFALYRAGKPVTSTHNAADKLDALTVLLQQQITATGPVPSHCDTGCRPVWESFFMTFLACPAEQGALVRDGG